MPKNIAGVVVDRIIPNSSAYGILKKDDVITKIQKKFVDGAGMIKFGEQQVTFFIEAENKQIGDSLEIHVWRNGKIENLTIKLKPPPFALEMRNSYDKLPEFLIFGGLVFIALNRNYINLPGNMTPPLAYEHWYRDLEMPGTRNDQTILISNVLPSSVNSGYTNFKNFVVQYVNGTPIESLEHLDNLLKNIPLEEQNVIFESEWNDLPIVLDYRESIKQNETILKKYGISKNSNIYFNK